MTEMLPASLQEALEALRADEELIQLLHPDFVRRYTDVKNAEMAVLESMTPTERRQWDPRKILGGR